MKLDRTFANEIKAVNGDGSREARFAFYKKLDAAHDDLSLFAVTRDTMQANFNECLKKHGRAVVAICVAATLDSRKERIDHWGFTWALQVLSLWTNRTPGGYSRAVISDFHLHPTMVCSYAKEFINLTTEG